VRNRNSPTKRTVTTTTQPTTIAPITEAAKTSRKVVRRKNTRNPNAVRKTNSPTPAPTTTTSKPTTTKASTTLNYELFTEVIRDEIASNLAALTSVKPSRRIIRPVVESTTRALQTQQPNNIEIVEKKEDFKPSSFDDLLQQQYKIKGLDINSEEHYEEDERLIGVLGSQVFKLFNFITVKLYFMFHFVG
jgi:hypothetical protein